LAFSPKASPVAGPSRQTREAVILAEIRSRLSPIQSHLMTVSQYLTQHLGAPMKRGQETETTHGGPEPRQFRRGAWLKPVCEPMLMLPHDAKRLS
jgi:hypothetical protein